MDQPERNNKRIAKNTFFLYTRMVIATVVSLFTVRVIFNALGVVDYGIYFAVGGIVLSMTFIPKVLALASQRFFSISIGKKDLTELKNYLTAIVSVYVILSVVIIIIAETAGLWFLNTQMTIPPSRLTAANITYQLSVAAFIITILSSPYQALIVSYEEMKVFAYISILDVVLKLVIVLFLLIDVSMDKLVVYAILMLVTTFASNIIYYIYCKRNYPETFDKIKWEWVRIKSILSYSSWTMFGTLSGICSNQGIGILYNIFWGPVANAAFAIATQVSNQVNMLAYNFFTAVRPALTKSYATDDKDYTKSLFFTSSKMIFLLLLVVILPFYIEAEEILKIWLGSVEPYMVPFVRQMLIFIMILSLSNPITAIMQAAGAVKQYHVAVDGFTLVSLPIAFIFLKSGCNAVHVLYIFNTVFLIAHFIRIILLNKVAPYITIRENLKFLGIPFIFVTALSTAVSAYLKMLTDTGIISLICTLVCTTISIIVSSYYILLTKEEKKKITIILQNKFLRTKS